MFGRLMLAASAFCLALSAPAHAQAVQPEDMMRHIRVLASDEYEGRKPGTLGETKTLLYLAQQFAALGMEPAAGGGSWYQPVGLVERKAVGHKVVWSANGQNLPFNQADITLLGGEAKISLQNRLVYFVGHGLPEQVAGADLKGAVALMLMTPPAGPYALRQSERIELLREAGASAVILLTGEPQWQYVPSSLRAGQNRLQIDEVPQVQGALLVSALQRLAPNIDLDAGEGFRPVRLSQTLSLDVTSEVRRYDSYNVIGRLRGRGRTGESVLFLGHWDHLGICAPESENRVCNGAVDNASGMAMMLEVVRHVGKWRHERDILLMGTTAEEMGLLGADYFARHPTVPLKSIVAAVNIDTVAIHRSGGAISYAGRGSAALDGAIEAAARGVGRTLDPANPADAFSQRQDGWVLAREGVPAVGLLGGAFSDQEALAAYLAGPYHKPDDDLNQPIVLEGALEDADLHIALGRRLADPKLYRPTLN